MKILVFQFDSRKDNENINLMLEKNRKYCELNGYDYVFENFDPLSVHHDFEDLVIDEKNRFKINLYFHRFEQFEKYLNENSYDYVVFFDSDMVVNNPFVKIEDLVDEKHFLYQCQDANVIAASIFPIHIAMNVEKYIKKTERILENPYQDLLNIGIFGQTAFRLLRIISTNPNGINCGFMIMKNSETMKEFIKDFKKIFFLFEDALFDQGTVASLLKTRKYKDIIKILPIFTQGNPLLVNQPEFSYNEEKNFLCHFYGHSLEAENVRRSLDEIMSNKWWSKVE